MNPITINRENQTQHETGCHSGSECLGHVIIFYHKKKQKHCKNISLIIFESEPIAKTSLAEVNICGVLHYLCLKEMTVSSICYLVCSS